MPTYTKVKYQGVYPGIDLVYYGNQRQLEYDFILAPGADPKRIQFDVSGVKKITPDGSGDLVLQMPDGEVRWHKPVVYQEDGGKRTEIAAQYVVKHKDEVTFEIAAYDRGKPLFIDPLVYSTYLGGQQDDRAYGIALDAAGNAYIAGYTSSSSGFPTLNAFQPTFAGIRDAFITKIDPTGKSLVYSTYLGGSSDDRALAIAVDRLENAYVTGFTTSTNFPTANALQPKNAGGQDAFVTKLDAAGSGLIYSTYLGGSNTDTGQSIATDSLGNTFVTGSTYSTNFPTMNPLQAANAGNGDIFLAKLDPTGSSFFYSTYLGGSGTDLGFGIAVDSVGKAYLTGSTTSTDFPTKNALQPVAGGNGDGFVSVVSPLGSTLAYSTYIGGKQFDDGTAIAVDNVGDAYITGATESTDFPTLNPVQSNNAGGRDAFVAELNSIGLSFVFSTYLGGGALDVGTGIALDLAQNIYVVGQTSSLNFPVVGTVPFGTGIRGDAFVTQLSPSGLAFVYSTYLGGSGLDIGRSIAVNSFGNAYATGYTTSHNFPLANPLQARYGGGDDDVFVSQLPQAQAAVFLAPTNLNFGNVTLGHPNAPMEINLTNSGSLTLAISSIQITGANGADYTQTNTCGGAVSPGQTCTVSVTFNPGTAGVKSANVTIADNAFDSPQSVSFLGAGVRPNATLSQTALTFATQVVLTTSQPQGVVLSNISAGTLFINSLAVAGQFAQTNNCGTSLSAGASCTINVTFQPLNRGTLTGTITITDNAPNSPQTVSLTGTGTFIQLIPTSINFGTQPIHTTSVGHKTAVTNKGSVAVSVSSISVVGMNPGDFAQTNTCGSSIASGATCTITVTFTPTVKGKRNANIAITDDGGGSPQRVSLSGTGT